MKRQSSKGLGSLRAILNLRSSKKDGGERSSKRQSHAQRASKAALKSKVVESEITASLSSSLDEEEQFDNAKLFVPANENAVPKIVRTMFDNKTPDELRALKTRIFARSNDSENSLEIISKCTVPEFDSLATINNNNSKESDLNEKLKLEAHRQQSSEVLLDISLRSNLVVDAGGKAADKSQNMGVNVTTLITDKSVCFEDNEVHQLISIEPMDQSEMEQMELMRRMREQVNMKESNSSISSRSRWARNLELNHTPETLAAIFVKPIHERTTEEYVDIHHFLCKQVKMFSNLAKTTTVLNKQTSRREYRLSYEDSMKCYKALHYRMFAPGEKICEYETVGDRFYIILQGNVSILQPNEIRKSVDTYWDVWNFMLAEHEKIRMYRDDNSRDIGLAIGLIGAPLLRKLAFKHVRKLLDFLRRIELTQQDVFSQYPQLDYRRICQSLPRLSMALTKLRSQLDLIDDVPNQGSYSRPQPVEKQLKLRIQIMEQVGMLAPGQHFGQDSLMSDVNTKRNATCQATSDGKVITTVLTKLDFKRILQEEERVIKQQCINELAQFDLFKNVQKRKLQLYFRLFYHPETKGNYIRKRNQYLYRQGDAVEGIYLILAGQVKRIKEQWILEEGTETIRGAQEPSDYGHGRIHTEISEATLKQVHDKKNSLGIINELKRSRAKQIILTIVQKGETLALEEVILKQPRHQHSVQVSSESCNYLFLTMKNFREKFYNNSFAFKKSCDERFEAQRLHHKGLENQRTTFRKQNDIITEAASKNRVLSNKEDPPFQCRLILNTQSAAPSNNDHQSSANGGKIIKKSILDTAPKSERIKLKADAKPQHKTAKKQQDERINLVDLQLSPRARLNFEIETEIEKDKPDIKKLVKDMQQQRKIVLQSEESKYVGQKSLTKLKDLSSNSVAGKIMEQNICRQFTRQDQVRITNHNAQSTATDSKHTCQKISIDKITNQLVDSAHGFSSRWKTERLQEEQALLIAQSLTNDRRLQKSLLVFSVRMKQFLDFVRQQGSDYYIHRLGVPCFEGSLLFDPEEKLVQQRSFETKQAETNRASLTSTQKLKPSAETIEGVGAKFQRDLSKRNSKSGVFQITSQQKNTLISPKNGAKCMSQGSVKVSMLSRNMSKKGSHESISNKLANQPAEKLDLMKVYHDWFEYCYTNQRLRKAKTNIMRGSSEQIVARQKETVIRLIQNSVDQNTLSVEPDEAVLSISGIKDLHDLSQLKSFNYSQSQERLLSPSQFAFQKDKLKQLTKLNKMGTMHHSTGVLAANGGVTLSQRSASSENLIPGQLSSLGRQFCKQKSLQHVRMRSGGMPYVSVQNQVSMQTAALHASLDQVIPEEDQQPPQPQIILTKQRSDTVSLQPIIITQESDEDNILKDKPQIPLSMGMLNRDLSGNKPLFSYSGPAVKIEQQHISISSAVTDQESTDHNGTLHKHTFDSQRLSINVRMPAETIDRRSKKQDEIVKSSFRTVEVDQSQAQLGNENTTKIPQVEVFEQEKTLQQEKLEQFVRNQQAKQGTQTSFQSLTISNQQSQVQKEGNNCPVKIQPIIQTETTAQKKDSQLLRGFQTDKNTNCQMLPIEPIYETTTNLKMAEQYQLNYQKHGHTALKTIDFNSCMMQPPRRLSYDSHAAMGSIYQHQSSKPLELVPVADHPSMRAGGSMFHLRLNQMKQQRKKKEASSMQFKTARASWISPLEKRKFESKAIQQQRGMSQSPSNAALQLHYPQSTESMDRPDSISDNQYQLHEKLASNRSRMQSMNVIKQSAQQSTRQGTATVVSRGALSSHMTEVRSMKIISSKTGRNSDANLTQHHGGKQMPSSQFLSNHTMISAPKNRMSLQAITPVFHQKEQETMVVKARRPTTAAVPTMGLKTSLPDYTIMSPMNQGGGSQVNLNLPTTQFKTGPSTRKKTDLSNERHLCSMRQKQMKDTAGADLPTISSQAEDPTIQTGINQFSQHQKPKYTTLKKTKKIQNQHQQHHKHKVQSKAHERFTERIMRDAQAQELIKQRSSFAAKASNHLTHISLQSKPVTVGSELQYTPPSTCQAIRPFYSQFTKQTVPGPNHFSRDHIVKRIDVINQGHSTSQQHISPSTEKGKGITHNEDLTPHILTAQLEKSIVRDSVISRSSVGIWQPNALYKS